MSPGPNPITRMESPTTHDTRIYQLQCRTDTFKHSFSLRKSNYGTTYPLKSLRISYFLCEVFTHPNYKTKREYSL